MGSLSKGAWHRTVGLMWKNHLVCVYHRCFVGTADAHVDVHFIATSARTVSPLLQHNYVKKQTKKTIRAHGCGGALRGPALADPWQHHRRSSKTALRWLSSPHKQIGAAPRWVREGAGQKSPAVPTRGIGWPSDLCLGNSRKHTVKRSHCRPHCSLLRLNPGSLYWSSHSDRLV